MNPNPDSQIRKYITLRKIITELVLILVCAPDALDYPIYWQASKVLVPYKLCMVAISDLFYMGRYN